MKKFLVSFWVEPKSYDDRPSNEYEDDYTVNAETAEDAISIVNDKRRFGQHWYGFSAKEVE